MGLIQCPDCGARVSDAAASCPSCARPIAAVRLQLTSPPGFSLLVKVLALFLVLLLVFLFLIIVQALQEISRPAVLARPVWVPGWSGAALGPVSAWFAFLLGIAVVGLAIHFGRRKGKSQAAKDSE